MKRLIKICIFIVILTLIASIFTGCEFWDNVKNQLQGGDTDDYTLTKNFTYNSNSNEPTKVIYMHQGEENGFKYKLYSDHAEIIGYKGEETDIVIPERIESIPVTIIAKNAFHQSNITSVQISNSVTEIGDGAFYEAKRLLQVTFGENVQVIGKYAFFGCDSLDGVYLNNTLREIKEYAFNSCLSLESIVITDSVESIGDHAFYLCQSMFKVFIPGSVMQMGDDVFGRCHQNFKIYAPASSVAHNYALQNSTLFIECYTHLEESYNDDTNDVDVSYDDEHEHGTENEETTEQA
ncbi:MAG: leucine-rich repeat domain-containing protein [Clostridia bacterium]|nr:leucine-rich repeat domain-containing protein [Clostridia bacterium]